MTRSYTTVLSTMVAFVVAGGSAVAYTVAERWVSYLVVAAAVVAVAGFVKAIQVQRDLDNHIEATRTLAADAADTAAKIRRTIAEE